MACIPNKQDALLYLLAEIAGVTDPAVIAENARCYACIPDKQAATLYLLDNIASSGSAAASAVTCSASDPVAAPAGSCGIHYNTATQAVFIWDGANWILKV